MNKMLSKNLDLFEKSDVVPGKEAWKAIIVFLVWALPAFLFVVWATKFYPQNELFQSAIKEGIGPNLWNIIGMFGLFSFGIALSLSNFSILALMAKQILTTTYGIGCLTFGLLVGQWYFLPLSGLTWWQQGLFGVTSVLLFVILFLYNLVVWYLCFLLQSSRNRSSNFLVKFKKLHWSYRMGSGLSISCIALLVFLNA